MKSFIHHSGQRSTLSVPEGWPSTAFTPDSDFFVPEELRGFYRVDSDREQNAFGHLDPDRRQRDASTDLPSLDYAIVAPTCTPKAMRAAGLNPADSEHRVRFLIGAARRITNRDRELHLHRWRLNQARSAVANEERRARARTEYRREHTCQVCEEFHNLTREVRFSRSDDPVGSGGPLLKATVCPACMELVRQEINQQAAESLTRSGKTRREVATALVLRATAGEQA